MRIRTLPSAAAGAGLLLEVRALVDDAFGTSFTDDDWTHALGGTHVLLDDGGRLVAHAAVVPRRLHSAAGPVSTGYVEAVATAPRAQGRGHGTRVMEVVARTIRATFELGALSTGRPAFYEPLGWERWVGPTCVVDAGRWHRTPDEDGAVMVLRHGPSAGLDLTGRIAVERRVGDDW